LSVIGAYPWPAAVDPALGRNPPTVSGTGTTAHGSWLLASSSGGAVMKRLKVGDYVREVDGNAVGIIVHIMRNAHLVVVNWPPSQHGIAFHPEDLVRVPDNG
jgi:hypothetical protein